MSMGEIISYTWATRVAVTVAGTNSLPIVANGRFSKTTIVLTPTGGTGAKIQYTCTPHSNLDTAVWVDSGALVTVVTAYQLASPVTAYRISCTASCTAVADFCSAD
jgi:hypothetical protein